MVWEDGGREAPSYPIPIKASGKAVGQGHGPTGNLEAYVSGKTGMPAGLLAGLLLFRGDGRPFEKVAGLPFDLPGLQL